MSSKIETSYLLPGFIWSFNDDAKYEDRKKYLLKLDKEIKSQFSYVEDKLNGQRGFSRESLVKASSLALYICRYMGNGIYFADWAEISDMFVDIPDMVSGISDAVYLLVVADGKIMAGTDIIVSRELFDFLINQIAGTEYSDLTVRKLLSEDLTELNRKYLSDSISAQQFSGKIWGLALMVFLILCGGGMALFILMA